MGEILSDNTGKNMCHDCALATRIKLLLTQHCLRKLLHETSQARRGRPQQLSKQMFLREHGHHAAALHIGAAFPAVLRGFQEVLLCGQQGKGLCRSIERTKAKGYFCVGGKKIKCVKKKESESSNSF